MSASCKYMLLFPCFCATYVSDVFQSQNLILFFNITIFVIMVNCQKSIYYKTIWEKNLVAIFTHLHTYTSHICT